MNWPLTRENGTENSSVQRALQTQEGEQSDFTQKRDKTAETNGRAEVPKERCFDSNAVKKEEKQAGQKVVVATEDVSTAGTTQRPTPLQKAGTFAQHFLRQKTVFVHLPFIAVASGPCQMRSVGHT